MALEDGDEIYEELEYTDVINYVIKNAMDASLFKREDEGVFPDWVKKLEMLLHPYKDGSYKKRMKEVNKDLEENVDEAEWGLEEKFKALLDLADRRTLLPQKNIPEKEI